MGAHGVTSDYLVLNTNVDSTATKNWPRYLFRICRGLKNFGWKR